MMHHSLDNATQETNERFGDVHGFFFTRFFDVLVFTRIDTLKDLLTLLGNTATQHTIATRRAMAHGLTSGRDNRPAGFIARVLGAFLACGNLQGVASHRVRSAGN